MVAPQTSRSRAKNRLLLLFIILLFVIPLATAWLLVDRWQSDNTTNHGQLLNPVQPTPPLNLQLADGGTLDTAYLRGRWTLLYIGNSRDCDENCRTGLYKIRQVRLALGKDMNRAQTLFAMDELPDAKLRSWLDREHPAMTRGRADAVTLAFFAEAFPGATSTGEWIYLIDPLGNLLMRYNVESDAKGILDDLKHLLKLSTIG